MKLRIALIFALLLAPIVAGAAFFRGGVQSVAPLPAIQSVTVSPGTFLGGSADGTSAGAIAVTLSSGSFTGTLAIGAGAQGADFRLSSTTLPANLLLNGTQTAGGYTVNLVPTQAGLSNSGTPFPVLITGTASQTIASIAPTSCGFTAGVQNGAVCTQPQKIFLVSGTSWTVPADWNNSANTIETIGGGGGSAIGVNGVSWSAGGGGGAYSKISNQSLTPGNSITIHVGSAGASASGGSSGAAGGDTWFNGASLGASSVGAKGGGGGVPGVPSSGGAGGSAASGVGSTKFNGGSANNGSYPGGGGGAGGPNGAGASAGSSSAGTPGGAGGGGGGGGSAGGTTSTNDIGTDGGNNSSGAGHGVGSTDSGTPNGTAGTSGGGGGGGFVDSVWGAGGNGGNGAEWDASHGSGGGGGASGEGPNNSTGAQGGSGGAYGGGAGSGSGDATAVNGATAGQGIIVITYTPLPTSLAVTMSPASPASTAALTLTGANSGAFHLVGAGCANISAGSCTIQQSSAAGGTPAGSYADVSVVATQGGISNSPKTQLLNLTGSGGSPTRIIGVGSTNTIFAAKSGNANSTIGTLSVAVSSGSFGGTLALATSGGCTGTNNGLFATSGSALKVGGSDITTAGVYSICVRATDATFGNSPMFQALTLTGTGAGLVVTTATYVNRSGGTLPAGTPISFGQGFRYGDIMPGTFPLIRDASTHTPLAGQQWDEISTWRENGGNGSWRHAVWAAWLPNSLSNGATYQVEFLTSAGTYSQTSHQALTALCSGAAAHDLKIHLTDVRNLNDVVRDSGDATFRLCDNIANVGRDAPRHLRAGNVYDEYQVNGMFVYTTSGNRDPLLYAQCNIDIFTKASDGVSAGDVRWVCEVHNSWMNVAAGSSGNAGNPGPAGFANDPQAISYRYEMLDGATVVLDQTNFDAVISSGSNPISPAGTAACASNGGGSCMTVSSSVGLNVWPDGLPTRISCSGTCVAGLTSGKLYYSWPASAATNPGYTNTQLVTLMNGPVLGVGALPMTNAQGTGTTTFSARVQHYYDESWETLDPSGQANWSPFGTTSRVTRKVYPVFTSTQKTYWEQTGLVVPIFLAQTPAVAPQWNFGITSNYAPLARGMVSGGAADGVNPDIGIVNEYSVQAFITQTEQDWDYARFFTYGGQAHGLATLFNEATGRIPPLNNGPPVGPGGNGNGGSYTGLGAPRNQAFWGTGGPLGIAWGCGKQNPAGIDICGGVTNGGTGLDHMPSVNGFTYMVFGDRHFLDMMYWHGNQDFLQQQVGPGPNLGQGYYRDNNAVFPGDGNTYHYWGLLTHCCQSRGSTWLVRDVIYPAAFGGDSNIERSYYNDLLTESANYEPLWLKFKDGSGNTNYSTSIAPGNDVTDGGPETAMFQVDYVANVAYIGQTFLHDRLSGLWNTRAQRITEGVMGGQLPGIGNGPGLIPTFYTSSFDTQMAIHDGDGGQDRWVGNVGQYYNGTDAKDFSIYDVQFDILTGGQVRIRSYKLAAGDQIKGIDPWSVVRPSSFPNLDQLTPANQYYELTGPIDNSVFPNSTAYIKCPIGHAVTATCPTPGAAFTGFSRAGVPVVNSLGAEVAKFRPQFDPGIGKGYDDNSHTPFIGQMMNGLNVLGYNVVNAKADFTARAGTAYYNPVLPSLWWDPTVVVPGLPAPVNSITALNLVFSPPTPSISCSSSGGTLVTALSTTGGSGAGNPVTYSLTGGDTTDFAVSGASVVVAPGGITSGGAACPLASPVTQNVTVTGTQ